MTNLPGVSYVMPVLNEERYIERAVASIQAQDYAGPAEILLVLGRSSDRTDDVVARLAESDPRIRTFANPNSDVPTGLNVAMRSAAHPIVIRADGHTELPQGYTARAVQTLAETGAANVGGVMVAHGQPGIQAAVARAYNSRLGLGGGTYHNARSRPGPAESAYLGVLRVDALRAVGYFDASLRRGQDWELNYRLRKAGYLVWLDPALRVAYWPRASLRALWRQMHATGIWRAEIVRRAPTGNSARYFVPPALVIATVLTLLLAPLLAFEPVDDLATATALGPAAYVALLAAVCARGRHPVADRLRFALVLATMHYAWGTGFVRGIVQGARGAVDRSRAPARAVPARPDLRRFPATDVPGETVGAGDR